jgi:hypothetical protein
MPNVKPIPGPASDSAIDQARMVVEAENALPNTEEHNARTGGSIYTCQHSEGETRPQEMHGSVNYQKTTSTGGKPNFVKYTELTDPRETIRG